MTKPKYLVSACLAGIECAYDGKHRLNKKVQKLVKEGKAIPICPEQLGGLPTPRKPAGIYGGTGEDVIKGKAKVRAARDGEDFTKQFVKGAEETLKIAKILDIKEVIFKKRSPSCGCGKTWLLDKNLRNHVGKGDGVTVALLKQNGIKIHLEGKS